LLNPESKPKLVTGSWGKRNATAKKMVPWKRNQRRRIRVRLLSQ